MRICSYPAVTELKNDAYDAVIDATGAIPVMSRTIDFARHGGKILLFGVPPSGEKMTLDAFQIFRKGLTILSSFTSLRNSYQALDCLKYRKVCVDEIISHCLPLGDFQKGIETIEQGLSNVKKVMLLPNSG